MTTDPAAWVAFFTALFVLQATPGPDMMLVLARGIGQGRRTALLTVVGMIFIAGLVQIGLLVLGVASLLQAHPTSLVVLRWVGAAYLLYLGARMLLASANGRKGVARPATDATPWQSAREGAINNLTNPKPLLFMFAFLPQFVDPSAGPVWLQLLVLGGIQKLSGFVVLGSVALASGHVGEWLHRWPGLLAWQARFTGVVMLGLGCRLIFAGDAAGHRPALR